MQHMPRRMIRLSKCKRVTLTFPPKKTHWLCAIYLVWDDFCCLSSGQSHLLNHEAWGRRSTRTYNCFGNIQASTLVNLRLKLWMLLLVWNSRNTQNPLKSTSMKMSSLLSTRAKYTCLSQPHKICRAIIVIHHSVAAISGKLLSISRQKPCRILGYTLAQSLHWERPHYKLEKRCYFLGFL